MQTKKYIQQALLPVVAFSMLIGAGCATTRAPGTKPDDMSHAGHMKAADKFNKGAATHARRYDPSLREGHVSDSNLLTEFPIMHFENPTSKHKDHAKRRREIARQHAAAARTLKRYEQRFCKNLPVEKRKAHPLPGRISRVELTSSGVRLHLKAGISAKAMLNSIGCHIAHARLRGFAGQKDCPLHLRGVRFRIATHGSAIELIAKRSNLVAELRRRVAAHRKP